MSDDLILWNPLQNRYTLHDYFCNGIRESSRDEQDSRVRGPAPVSSVQSRTASAVDASLG
jgi:hypothetical protein